MAKMIPADGPREFTPESHEDIIYRALSKLPDDYWVIHSFKMLTVDKQNTSHDGEADFVVFNEHKGIICIESKAGNVCYDGSKWLYGNGIPIHHGKGPYYQARKTVYDLIEVIEDRIPGDLKSRLKIHHAVWFPGIDRKTLLSFPLPPETGPRERNRSITLTADDLLNPLEQIDSIYSLNVPGVRETSVTKQEVNLLFSKVFRPVFNLTQSLERYEWDNQEYQFYMLLEGQKKVLDFIQDESFVAIQGLSGTGKTLVATELARRKAEAGKRVLFLCYNAMLRDSLRDALSEYPFISVLTLAAFVKEASGWKLNFETHLDSLCEKLADYERDGNFPYESVIIDEAQDFGHADLTEYGFFETLQSIMRQKGGSLHAFYDPNQRVMTSSFPTALLEADTRLTLRVNCRNTREIAMLSQFSAGIDSSKNYLSKCVHGVSPRIHFVDRSFESTTKCVKSEVRWLKKQGVRKEDIVVLTCDSGNMEYREDVYGVSTQTCRKFKGLEADAVILVDVKASEWINPSEKVGVPGGLVYVGSSRAKRFLSIVCQMSDEDCRVVLENVIDGKCGDDPRQSFADYLGAAIP